MSIVSVGAVNVTAVNVLECDRCCYLPYKSANISDVRPYFNGTHLINDTIAASAYSVNIGLAIDNNTLVLPCAFKLNVANLMRGITIDQSIYVDNSSDSNSSVARTSKKRNYIVSLTFVLLLSVVLQIH